MPVGAARLEREGAIARIAFSNPPQGLMDEAMEADLLAAVEAVTAEPTPAAACLLTGADPGVFIRHYDVAVISQNADAMALRGLVFRPERPVPAMPIHRAMALMRAAPTLFIAALDGTAMGGGFELALACDLRIVAEGPHLFGLPEINLGLLPGAGGTQRLTRLIGEARALEMTLLGETVGPHDLVAMGLARSAGAGSALAAAETMAERLAALPPLARTHIKRLVLSALDTPLDQGLAVERTLFCDVMITPDARTLMRQWVAGERTITDPPQMEPER